MKFFALTAVVFGLSACTAANPLYLGPGGGSKHDGGISSPDLASGSTPQDLGGPMSHPDLAQSPTCNDGERQCVSNASWVCENGKPAGDRHCPLDGTCSNGYCQPPAPMNLSTEGQPCDPNGSPYDGACQTTGTQSAYTCQPFVVDAQDQQVTWTCAQAIGPGGIGTPCTRGGECRSGFCGSNGTCFRACDPNLGCPIGSNGMAVGECRQVDLTVEGVPVSAYSCVR